MCRIRRLTQWPNETGSSIHTSIVKTMAVTLSVSASLARFSYQMLHRLEGIFPSRHPPDLLVGQLGALGKGLTGIRGGGLILSLGHSAGNVLAHHFACLATADTVVHDIDIVSTKDIVRNIWLTMGHAILVEITLHSLLRQHAVLYQE